MTGVLVISLAQCILFSAHLIASHRRQPRSCRDGASSASDAAEQNSSSVLGARHVLTECSSSRTASKPFGCLDAEVLGENPATIFNRWLISLVHLSKPPRTPHFYGPYSV